MPITNYMIEKVYSVTADMPIKDVINFIEEKRVRWVPVVSKDNHFLGAFSTHILIKLLLPSVTTIEGGIEHLNFIKSGKDHLKKRLKEIGNFPVSEFMDKDYPSISINVSEMEGLVMMFHKGSPLPVLAEDSKEMLGVISHQTAIKQIQEIVSKKG